MKKRKKPRVICPACACVEPSPMVRVLKLPVEVASRRVLGQPDYPTPAKVVMHSKVVYYDDYNSLRFWCGLCEYSEEHKL